MIRPKPVCYSCPACHWRKCVHPRSDAMILGQDVFDACPRCGNPNLQTRPWAGTLSERLQRLLQPRSGPKL